MTNKTRPPTDHAAVTKHMLNGQALQAPAMNTFPFEHGTVDFVRAEVVYHDGQRCALSQRELDLLAYLSRKPGIPASRDELLAEVWKINPANVLTRTVDMHISSLRRKLRDTVKKPVILKTINRHGYLLVSPAIQQR